MSGSFDVRPFRTGDAAELVALCREHMIYERASLPDVNGGHEQERAERMSQLFGTQPNGERPTAYCWVVAVENEIAGFASAALELSTWMIGHYLHLDCLFVREPYRGQGLGQALMHCIARKTIELGAVNLQWQTPAWNEAGIRFYRRLGAVHITKQRFTLDRDACARLDSIRQASS